MVRFLIHLLAAYAVLATPWVTRVWYAKARRRIASGIPDAKLRLYRSIVGEQILVAGVVLAFCVWGGISAPGLGLVAPRSWVLTLVAMALLIGALAWSSLRIRPKALQIRKRIQDGIGALLPDTNPERRWWGAVSVGAGVSEELGFRGFLFYYLSAYVPHINTREKVVLSSLVFGMGHIYQGW
jgi:uncharacterized protein